MESIGAGVWELKEQDERGIALFIWRKLTMSSMCCTALKSKVEKPMSAI